jgi:uncharacterized membrane protein
MDPTLDLLMVSQVLILILGGIVVYYATRSYRKAKSNAMLFLAIGFGFVTLGAAVAGILYNLTDANSLMVAQAVQATFQAIGFFIIVYSLKWAKE